MARGTDIHCYYQRGINWAAVQDIHFVWAKVSDGGSPYSKLVGGVTYRPDGQIAGALSRGFPVGGYCYAQPESKGGSPEHQADVLAAECRRLGAVGVTPMMDLEEPGTVSRSFGERSCNQLVARGFRPAVYMNASDAQAIRPDQWNVPGLVIVIARYGARPEGDPARGVKALYTGRYDVHQYSSSGALPGSAGAVDLDESYNDNHLATTNTTGGFMSGFNGDDFRAFMWGNEFDIKGHRNYASFVKDMDAKIGALGTSLTAVTKLLTDNPDNPVDVEQLAAALEGKLVAELVPAVTAAVGQAAGEEAADEVRKMLVARLGNPA